LRDVDLRRRDFDDVQGPFRSQDGLGGGWTNKGRREMKRAFIPTALVAAAILVFAVVNAAAGGSRKSESSSIHVIEHATTDAVTNGTAGDSAGNVLTFANDVFNAANVKKVGSDQGYCIRIVVGKTWECNWTTFLGEGQITVEGPFSDTGDTTLAITGGTGKYRNARGSMELNYHNPAGTEFDFVFHLNGND
jgi:allene oxide cyclase